MLPQPSSAAAVGRLAACLQERYVQVSGQHGSGGIAPQGAAQPVEHLVVALRSAQVGQRLVQVAPARLAPHLLYLAVQALSALHRVQHLLGVPQRDGHARVLGRVLDALRRLPHQSHQLQRLRAVHAALQKALAAHAVVVLDAGVLLHVGVPVNVQPDVIVHPGLLHAGERKARLVDVPLGQLAQLPERCDHLVVVLGQVLFDLSDDAGAQRILPLAHLVGVQLVPALVHGHKLAQLHGLGPLASHALQALGGQAHVRNGRAAVQQVVHTLPVLQLHPQLRHHVVGHQPRPAVLGLQSDVHQIVGKMVQLLLVLRPCQVGKDGFALGGDPALPGLSIVQHPPQLLHKAAVDIAAKALEVPLDVRGVYPVHVPRRTSQLGQHPLFLLGGHLLQLTVQPLGKVVYHHVFDAAQHHGLVLHDEHGLLHDLPQPPQLLHAQRRHRTVMQVPHSFHHLHS